MTQPGAETDTDWRRRALAAEASLAELRRERARLWDELHRERARGREDDYFYRLYQDLEASISWRLTRPLRLTAKYARKARKLLEERN